MEPYKVAVFGLGYVGLPVALFCQSKGYEVIGIDVDPKKVATINRGRSPIKDPYIASCLRKGLRIEASTNPRDAEGADVITISVPTDTYVPLEQVSHTVGRLVKKGSLVVIESTVEPGTCEERVIEILQAELSKRGSYKVGRDVYVAHCPERINPGDPIWTVENIPRVVGATSKRGLERAVSFYSSLLGPDAVTGVSSIATAEMCKVLENTFRGYNIALANGHCPNIWLSIANAKSSPTSIIYVLTLPPFLATFFHAMV
ncbi:MAG TPA: nucleotide sugar dehydrogenase [Candidatus Nanoarchaeia archaeon]|nr:nucleotide sugar dehydrogenase [Candidatus Nanoarchaeia archaeon]